VPGRRGLHEGSGTEVQEANPKHFKQKESFFPDFVFGDKPFSSERKKTLRQNTSVASI
jgi:hypothetical protein